MRSYNHREEEVGEERQWEPYVQEEGKRGVRTVKKREIQARWKERGSQSGEDNEAAKGWTLKPE